MGPSTLPVLLSFLVLFVSFSTPTSFSPPLPGGGPSEDMPEYGPGLVREEGEGLLEVELEVETGGEMTLGDLIGGDVGEGEEPAGGCGLS